MRFSGIAKTPSAAPGADSEDAAASTLNERRVATVRIVDVEDG